MNDKQAGKRRIQIIAAVCAVLLITGSGAGILASRPKASAQASQTEQQPETVKTSAEKDQSFSAGGTVSCSQHTDTLGLVNTSVRLTVGAVLVSSGDTVTEGTALYEITSDSLAKAEKTLRSELQSAESALKKQQAQAQLDESKAGILYESELLLGDTAQQDYSSGISELDSALQEACDSYTEAQNTVNNTPSEIASKKNSLAGKQSEAANIQAQQQAAQENADSAEAAYRSAADSYNSIAAEYNSAAAVVRYLGKALGRDVSDINDVQSASAETKKQNSPSVPDSTDRGTDLSGGFGGDTERPEGMMQGTRFFSEKVSDTQETESGQPEGFEPSQMPEGFGRRKDG